MQTWYCIIGTNDLRDISSREVSMNPQRILDGFVTFFDVLHSLVPTSRIVWVNVGQSRLYDPSFSTFRLFKTFLSSRNAKFPDWLVYQDITYDCQTIDIKDKFGHWRDHYIERIAIRLLHLIMDHEINENVRS